MRRTRYANRARMSNKAANPPTALPTITEISGVEPDLTTWFCGSLVDVGVETLGCKVLLFALEALLEVVMSLADSTGDGNGISEESVFTAAVDEVVEGIEKDMEDSLRA